MFKLFQNDTSSVVGLKALGLAKEIKNIPPKTTHNTQDNSAQKPKQTTGKVQTTVRQLQQNLNLFVDTQIHPAPNADILDNLFQENKHLLNFNNNKLIG